MDADISGKDVPIAIIVRPMNVSGTLNSEAILTEEFTTASADIINIMIPKNINKIVNLLPTSCSYRLIYEKKPFSMFFNISINFYFF